MDIPTLLKVEEAIKDVQTNMISATNSYEDAELIKEVCQACDYEIFKLIEAESQKNIVEKLRLSELQARQDIYQRLNSLNARLTNLEREK